MSCNFPNIAIMRNMIKFLRRWDWLTFVEILRLSHTCSFLSKFIKYRLHHDIRIIQQMGFVSSTLKIAYHSFQILYPSLISPLLQIFKIKDSTESGYQTERGRDLLLSLYSYFEYLISHQISFCVFEFWTSQIDVSKNIQG